MSPLVNSVYMSCVLFIHTIYPGHDARLSPPLPRFYGINVAEFLVFFVAPLSPEKADERSRAVLAWRHAAMSARPEVARAGNDDVTKWRMFTVSLMTFGLVVAIVYLSITHLFMTSSPSGESINHRETYRLTETQLKLVLNFFEITLLLGFAFRQF